MAYVETWDDAFEAGPADTDDAGDGGDEIRDLKLAIRERMEHDHYFNPDGVDVDHGEHKKITFHEPITTPANVVNKGVVFIKDVSNKVELHWLDEDGNELQLTAAGVLHGARTDIPSGETILFEKDTVVVGYTLLTDKNDMTVFVTKGNAAGGEAGGTDKTGGTWTQPDHILTKAELPAHVHTYDEPLYGTDGVRGAHARTSSAPSQDTGDGSADGLAGAAHHHGDTWRPSGRNFTRQTRS